MSGGRFRAPAVLSEPLSTTRVPVRGELFARSIDFQLKIHTNSDRGQLAQFAANNGYG